MKNFLIKISTGIIGFFYRNAAKKALFRLDPETAHERMLRMGKFLGSNAVTQNIISLALNFSDKSLGQTVCGIKFKNPVGLSAGFDKNAELTGIIPSVGFGFMEVGSITGEYCEGNPKPRLWRLPKSKSILVYYGLKNEGCETISKKLADKKFKIPVGISVAKTNSPETIDLKKGVADYVKCAKAFSDSGIGDYFTINISCPNAYGGQPFTDPSSLEMLLTEFDKLKIRKPIFIKMPQEIACDAVDKIIDSIGRHNIQGLICTNLAKKRDNPEILQEELENLPKDKGGFSGKPTEKSANDLIGYIYKKTGGKYVIIGCGGIFTAEDAYKKIKLGASLLQMITGMIFGGPQAISEINSGLAELLKKDGFKNVSEAIGKDAK